MKCGTADQVTSWGLAVDPANLLMEYPRPQLVRGDATVWKVLNGVWQYQFGTGASEPPPFNKTLTGTILVPFPPESCLSGIGETPPNYYSWYRLLFDSPFAAGGGSTLIHAGAIDWNSTAWLNGVQVRPGVV